MYCRFGLVFDSDRIFSIDVDEPMKIDDWYLTFKNLPILQKDHEPNFPLRHAHKDMALASQMAKDAGVEFSVMDQAEILYRSACDDEDLKLADLDFSAVFEKIHQQSKSDFSKKRKADNL